MRLKKLVSDFPKIVCVDDEVLLLMCMQRYFAQEFPTITIDYITSCKDVLEYVDINKYFKLIFLMDYDLKCPEYNGAKLIDEIKRRHNYSTFIANSSMPECNIELMNHGASFIGAKNCKTVIPYLHQLLDN